MFNHVSVERFEDELKRIKCLVECNLSRIFRLFSFLNSAPLQMSLGHITFYKDACSMPKIVWVFTELAEFIWTFMSGVNGRPIN